MHRVDYICSCNVGDVGDNDNTANIVSSINVDNIEMEGTDTVSSVVRAFTSEQN